MYTEEEREHQIAQIKQALCRGKPKSLLQLSKRLGIHAGIVVIRLVELERREVLHVIVSVPPEGRTHTTNRLYAGK